MTEDEAKITQCCGPEGCGYFNDKPHPARWCVGSACMAWRWSDGAVEREWTAKGEPPPGPEWVPVETNPSSDERFAQRWERPRPNRAGFCGLAGAPS